jgi:hypothetical protein
MRHIRVFQVGDLFLGQFNGKSADGIFHWCCAGEQCVTQAC